MQRIAFRLRVREEKLEEYKAHHREAWPELLADMHKAGYRNYSIFADGPELFGYLECENWNAAQHALSASNANRRWQAFMADYLATPVNPDDESSLRMLEPVFYME